MTTAVSPLPAPVPHHSASSSSPRACACAARQPQPLSGVLSASESTPFDAPSAYMFANHDLANRASCARLGAMAMVRAAGLSFGPLGVTDTSAHGSKLEAAHALLCTGSCIECNATSAVIQQLDAVTKPSTADAWLRQLFWHGVARIDASWGFGDILRRGDLAGLLRRRLDALGDQSIYNMKAADGEQMPAFLGGSIPGDRRGSARQAQGPRAPGRREPVADRHGHAPVHRGGDRLREGPRGLLELGAGPRSGTP